MKHSKKSSTRWLLTSTALGLGAAPLFIGALLLPSPTFALPVGGIVSGGEASIGSAGSHTVVFQGSDRAVIDWQSFDVGSGETVHFSQASASSAILNRIHDVDASRIDGTLSATGQVYLVNPNGMVFGQGSRVDVGSLVASTADISNAAFMRGGVLDFDIMGRPDAAIINHGSLTVAEGGLAAFVAPHVSNSGIITAHAGTVALAAGDRFTLDMYGDDLLHVSVSDAVAHQSVTQRGSVYAHAGTVLLTTAEAASVIDSVINTSGLTDASSATEEGGTIVFAGQGADIRVSAGAILDASGALGGGTVRIGGEYQGSGETPTARTVAVEKGATIKANATRTGNGGEVIVWSDKTTIFAGHIEAKGGVGEASRPSEPSAREAASHASDSTSRSGDKPKTNNGSAGARPSLEPRANGAPVGAHGAQTHNGGFVETSGKEKLYATGTVDASAPNGQAGQWLLDPTNVTISNGAGTDVSTCSASPHTCNGVATIDANTIQTALNGGTSVTVTTTSGGADAGDITLSNVTINKGTGGDATLTFKAENNITTSGTNNINATGGKLNTVFWANSDAAGTGAVNLTNTTITTNGGNVRIGGGLDNGANGGVAGDGIPDNASKGNATINDGVYMSNTTISTDGGSITMRGDGRDLAGTTGNMGVFGDNAVNLLTTSGAINLYGNGGIGVNSNVGVQFEDVSLVRTDSGNIYMEGRGGAGTTTWNTGLDFWANATIQSNSGNISFVGYGGSGTDFCSGMVFETASSVSTISGNISLNGTVGNASGTNASGVFLWGGSITSQTGNISLTGQGGTNVATSENAGVKIANGSQVTSTGTGVSAGRITMNGTGTSGVANNYGVLVTGASTLVSAVDGRISMTGQGGAGTASNNDGVRVSAGADVRSLGSTDQASGIIMNGTAGNGDDTNRGVNITGAGTEVTTAKGNISFTGVGGSTGVAGSINNHGVGVNSNATVSAQGGGRITMDGTGANGEDGNTGIAITTASVVSDYGDISLTGRGGSNGAVDSNASYGVLVSGGGNVTSNGSGATAARITVNGTGGAGEDLNHGIYVSAAGSKIQSIDGDISLTGDGGNGALKDDNNSGVRMDAGATIVSTGTTTEAATITLNGTGGRGDDNNRGIYFTNVDTAITSVRGDINITGTGGTAGLAGSNTGFGIEISTGVSVSSASAGGVAGNITLNGTGSNGLSSNHGVFLSGGTLTSDLGNIRLTGQSGSNGAAGSNTNYGISVTAASTIESTGAGANAGRITLDGTGARGEDVNYGVLITGAGTRLRSQDGDITVTGRASTQSFGDNNTGIQVEIDADIQSTGTTLDAADIILNGTGGTGDDLNRGVQITTAGTTVSAIRGNISITGQGRSSGVAGNINNHGVAVVNNAVVSTAGGASAAGSITINGTAGSADDTNHGVFMDTAGTVTSDKGAITLTGTGGSNGLAASDTNAGVFINSGTVSSTGTGTALGAITITGTGASAGSATNYGVHLTTAAAQITTVDADVSITGTGGGTGATNHGVYILTDSDVRSTGGGSIAITGTAGAGGTDIVTTGGTIDIGGVASTGNLTLSMHSNSFANTNFRTTRDITLRPRDSTRSIGVSGGAGLFQVSDALIAMMNPGRTLHIGDIVNGSGAVHVDDWNMGALGYGVGVYGGTMNVDNSAFNRAITGAYKGTDGVLRAGTNTINATTSFNSLNIISAGATLLAGYVGAPTDGVNQNMANQIFVNGVRYPQLTANPAYTFAGFVIGAANSLGGGGATPPTVVAPLPPLPEEPLAPTTPPEIVTPAPQPLPDIIVSPPSDGFAGGLPESVRESSGFEGLPTVYTHPSSYLKNFVQIGDATPLVTLDTNVENIDVQHQEHKDDRDSELVEDRSYLIDPHLRAWLRGE